LISRMEIMADGAYRVDMIRQKTSSLTTISFSATSTRHESRVQRIRNREHQISPQVSSVTKVDSRPALLCRIADVMIGAAMQAANALKGFRNPLLDPRGCCRSTPMTNSFTCCQRSTSLSRSGSGKNTGCKVIDYFAANFTNSPATPAADAPTCRMAEGAMLPRRPRPRRTALRRSGPRRGVDPPEKPAMKYNRTSGSHRSKMSWWGCGLT